MEKATIRISDLSLWLLVAPVFLSLGFVSAGPARWSEATEPDIERLRRIERDVLPPTLVHGPARHSELIDYYGEANADLKSRFANARQALTAEPRRPYRAMTVVTGPAGIGKTFVKRQVYGDVPKDKIWKFDIRELFEELAHQQLAEFKPDLQHGDRVFNRLASLKPEGQRAFVKLLKSNAKEFVVVDSLDEIHPDDYDFALDALHRFALEGEHGFMHLVVFGRPTAFRNFWRDNASVGPPDLEFFVLNKPQFRTTGDLLVSNWNYDVWKHKLRREGDQSDAGHMSLGDYQRWCKAGFPVDGEFSDVAFAENVRMTPTAREQLQQWTMDYPIVTSGLTNLAANGMVRDILADHLERGDVYDERQFMSEFLTKWLERDTRSDDRPSRLKPELFDTYLRLLETIAAKYAGEGTIDDRGYFAVGDDDQVVVRMADGLMTVPVLRVLNRSGLVTVDPRHRFHIASALNRSGSIVC